MAYKYQPIKDEILVSDTDELSAHGEGEIEEVEEDSEYVGVDLEEQQLPARTTRSAKQSQLTTIKADEVVATKSVRKQEIVQEKKINQAVIEQDGVLILETIDADANGTHVIPEGSTVITSGYITTSHSQIIHEGDILDGSAVLAETSEIVDANNLLGTSSSASADNGAQIETQEEHELEDCHLCGKKVEQLDKHILANHGEKVECQLCNKYFPVGNLRWHILKEHCHNKVTECSLCEQKFVTKNALKNHIKQVHLSETSTCHICHKEYKDLYHHVKFFHDRIRNFECSYCEKKFQAKKLLYNHVQSIHLGEKTRCPECDKEISVDNFSRHVRETHEKAKKPCPHCDKEFAMSNLSRHIRQVHNNESTECPDCGKALTISNLNKHIKSVHKKLKKTCEVCNEEVPYSSISVHKRKVHGIGKSIDEVTPRGPNLKLRKRYRQMIENEMEFDRLTEAVNSGKGNKVQKLNFDNDDDSRSMDHDIDEHDLMEEEDEDDEDIDEGMGTKVIQVGDRNFTFSFA